MKSESRATAESATGCKNAPRPQGSAMYPDPRFAVLHEQNFAHVGAPAGKFPGQELHDECDHQHHVKRRVNRQPAANEKALKTDRSALVVLLVQKTGNQEVAQREKQIHAHETHSGNAEKHGRVMEQHQQNRRASQYIQPLNPHRSSPVLAPKRLSRSLHLGNMAFLYRRGLRWTVASHFGWKPEHKQPKWQRNPSLPGRFNQPWQRYE